MHPGAVEFVRRALREPFAAGELRMITVPAPPGRPERLLGVEARGPAVYWAAEPRSGGADTAAAAAVAGAGAAHLIAAEGHDRFDRVRLEADRLWPRIRAITHADAPAPSPRLFGGFSFLAGTPAAPWRRFGEATFVLPRLLYTLAGSAAALSVVVTEEEASGDGWETLARRLDCVADRLSAPGSVVDDTGVAVGAETVEAMDRAAWTDAVETIRGRIAEGRAAKVVAARRTVLRLASAPDPEVVLGRLEREASAEVRFALRCGGATLLGATPERLIARQGATIRTEALAGSIGTARVGGGERPADTMQAGPAEQLLRSAKDAEEHAFVVAAIASALGPLCDRLEYPPEPRVQRLRHVLHLQTPFEGGLAAPVHVLELVKRLHPTPAVGGTPTPEALEWIAGCEPADRGWYAAPVGWFDAAGDGDFVVALRSGLLHEDLAYLYAGAGIVRHSDAAAEYAETTTKLKTMMDALGFAG